MSNGINGDMSYPSRAMDFRGSTPNAGDTQWGAGIFAGKTVDDWSDPFAAPKTQYPAVSAEQLAKEESAKKKMFDGDPSMVIALHKTNARNNNRDLTPAEQREIAIAEKILAEKGQPVKTTSSVFDMSKHVPKGYIEIKNGVETYKEFPSQRAISQRREEKETDLIIGALKYSSDSKTPSSSDKAKGYTDTKETYVGGAVAWVNDVSAHDGTKARLTGVDNQAQPQSNAQTQAQPALNTASKSDIPTYAVQSKLVEWDTVAKKTGKSVEDLKAWNQDFGAEQVQGLYIKQGAQVKLAPPKEESIALKINPKFASAIKDGKYEILKGGTPADVARNVGVSVKTLLDANGHIAGLKANTNLTAGTKLNLPGVEAKPATTIAPVKQDAKMNSLEKQGFTHALILRAAKNNQAIQADHPNSFGQHTNGHDIATKLPAVSDLPKGTFIKGDGTKANSGSNSKNAELYLPLGLQEAGTMDLSKLSEASVAGKTRVMTLSTGEKVAVYIPEAEPHTPAETKFVGIWGAYQERTGTLPKQQQEAPKPVDPCPPGPNPPDPGTDKPTPPPVDPCPPGPNPPDPGTEKPTPPPIEPEKPCPPGPNPPDPGSGKPTPPTGGPGVPGGNPDTGTVTPRPILTFIK